MKKLASVISPGVFTTIQDLGRPGLRHLGVPLSGAADNVSFAFANSILGNSPDAAGLECTLNGPSLLFLTDTAIAITGADMNPQLNGARIPSFERLSVHTGDQLSLSGAKVGARSYIAFEGGLRADVFLGSRSTYITGRLGGLNGRKLSADDTLISEEGAMSSPIDIPPALRPHFSTTHVVRATEGPESHLFPPTELATFFTTGWHVNARADRIGAKLDGPPLDTEHYKPLASSPVFPGVVQYTPSGSPFLLLADAQTIGGYPRIAQVICADRHLTGQMRPGDTIWFRQTTPEEARDITRKKAALLHGLVPGNVFY